MDRRDFYYLYSNPTITSCAPETVSKNGPKVRKSLNFYFLTLVQKTDLSSTEFVVYYDEVKRVKLLISIVVVSTYRSIVVYVSVTKMGISLDYMYKI